MKKIFGFLGVAMLMSLAGCSNDDFLDGAQAGGGTEVGTKGDMFMTLNVSQLSSIGTRTQTPNQGYEIGKDYENKISSALVILAESTTTGYKIVFSSGTPAIPSGDINGGGNASGEHGDNLTSGSENPDDNNHYVGDNTDEGWTGGDQTGHNTPNMEVWPDPAHTDSYTASFSFDRASLLGDIEEHGEELGQEDTTHEQGTKKRTYTIFVVANPSDEMVNRATAGVDVQYVFEMGANNNQYWGKNTFLMSSAQPATCTIYADEIPYGSHTTKPEAYSLGTVYVQRAMSRFDLATDTNHKEFEGEGDTDPNGTGKSELSNIKVTFDAVAMINMAKKANLFKVMALNQTALGSKTMNFADERDSHFADNWVFSPNQNNQYWNQLFSGMSGTPDDKLEGSAVAFKDFFKPGEDFQLIANLSEPDETFEHTNHNTANQGNYSIWRYAMENTNPDQIDNQKNGVSTGVVFRAKLSETTPDPQNPKIPTSYSLDDREKNGEAIYAYNNVILGTAEQLKDYATNPKSDDDTSGVYEAVRNIYASAISNALESNKNEASNSETGWTIEDGYVDDEGDDAWYQTKDEDYETNGKLVLHYGNLGDLDTFLVGQGFNIYRPEKVGEVGEEVPVYYCYYLYWNRHNDNNQNTVMGIMEFATVRNNVYKLSVNAVKRLGHPGEPDDDPNTPDPDDPDEEDELWLDVDCQILPWEVRINNIEF